MLQDMPRFYLFTLVILSIVWLTAYVAGMITGKPNALRTRRLPRASRMIMIGVALAFGSLAWAGWAHGTLFDAYACWILVGLAMGALGDLLLGGVLPIQQPDIIAMAVFGIGHACYLAAIIAVQRVLGIPSIYLAIGAATSVIIGFSIWIAAVRNPSGSRKMNIGSLAYGSMLFITAGLGVGSAIASHRMSLLAIGLSLFALSDVILAQYMVRRRRFPYIRDVAWIIYSTAQLLIAFSSKTLG